MNNNSHEQLIKLHKVEKRLLEINHSRGSLPQKISILNEKINNLITENKNYENRLSEIGSRKTLLNSKISDIENKISTLNEQMYKVKSNREYEALLSEIDHLTNENIDILKELETFDNELESIDSSIKENNENLELLNKELSTKENQLKETNSEFEKEEKELEKDRDSFIKDLSNDASLIGIYNDKKIEYNGLAFAEINRDCCENCFSSLPPQLIIDAKNREQLVLCPSCNILLYIEVEDLVNKE